MELKSASLSYQMQELSQAKVVLLGDPHVGKSSILQRFITESFTDHNFPTLGATFITKILCLNKTSIKLNIWDTAGQERFNSLALTYCRDSDACILVYDITNRETFEGIKRWHSTVKSVVSDHAIFAVVGNKEDKFAKETVSQMEAKYFSNSIGAIFSKTSAKDGAGIKELFVEISQKLVGEDYLSYRDTIKSSNVTSKATSLNPSIIIKKKRCCS